MAEAERPYAQDKDGLRLAVRLTPRAGRDGVDGIVRLPDGRPVLQLRLAAPPVDGAANKALLAFVAGALGLRKSAVTIRSGETVRLKILHLSGDAAELAGRLEAWLAQPGTPSGRVDNRRASS